ncbi:MAG: RHS repeat-associated core domain-containing protein [Planctomycetaceae bacterium]|nr:RHS repeat-associated core domain-containing protein [Planctomycetaceae bacterium]
MLADPLHLSRHQRTPSPPPLSSSCSSHRSAKLKTSNPCNHRNQQYSIIGLTNAAGTLVERYSYSAYGTLGIYAANGTVRTTSTYANRYTYTGREYDADLNLYHFRARWYDPSTAGFISRDPLGYVDGMSLYRGYFGIQGRDYSGMCKAGDCIIEAQMRAVRFRFVGKNGAEEEVFESDPFDDLPGENDPDGQGPFDPDSFDDITDELLKKLLKKLIAKFGLNPILMFRAKNALPTMQIVEVWLDRIYLEVGFDVDCTKRECVEIPAVIRWGSAIRCWLNGFPVVLPETYWDVSDFDCGGPYWISVDSVRVGDTNGNAAAWTPEEIREKIRKHEWAIRDSTVFSKVIQKMKALQNIPAGCTVEQKQAEQKQ